VRVIHFFSAINSKVIKNNVTSTEIAIM